jgi:hypothetical protein
VNLDGQQWEQVRVFVEEFFEQQPEKASKATYRSLFKEIQSQYPCLILSPQVFTLHIASIEKLRADAGIQGEVEISKRAPQLVFSIRKGISLGCVPDRSQAGHRMLEELC